MQGQKLHCASTLTNKIDRNGETHNGNQTSRQLQIHINGGDMHKDKDANPSLEINMHLGCPRRKLVALLGAPFRNCYRFWKGVAQCSPKSPMNLKVRPNMFVYYHLVVENMYILFQSCSYYVFTVTCGRPNNGTPPDRSDKI